jgi:hypothetical protein
MTSQPWMTMHFSRTYIIVFSLFIIPRTLKLILERQPTSVNDIFTPSDQTSPYRWYLLSGITYMASLNDAVAVMFTTQDLIERRFSEMTTPASPLEDHHKHRRRRATVDQTTATTTGWARSGSFFFPAARTGTRRYVPTGEISSISRSCRVSISSLVKIWNKFTTRNCV